MHHKYYILITINKNEKQLVIVRIGIFIEIDIIMQVNIKNYEILQNCLAYTEV
jgi:hypothetical protein